MKKGKAKDSSVEHDAKVYAASLLHAAHDFFIDEFDSKEKSEFDPTVHFNDLRFANTEEERLLWIHEDFIKSTFNMDDIRVCLKGVNNNHIQQLIIILKPIPLEAILINTKKLSYPNYMIVTFKHTIRIFNQKIKALSPIIKRINNLHRERLDHYDNQWKLISKELQSILEFHGHVVTNIKEWQKKFYKTWMLDKNVNKEPQKHSCWNVIIPEALRYINKYSHSDRCKRVCKTIHAKSYRKIAELLKILYPTIWKEDVETITKRIKQKDYRHA